MEQSEKLFELSKEIYSAAYSTIVDEKVTFSREYSKLDSQVREAIKFFRGVKTDVYLDFSENTLTKLNLSLIFSDFVSVFPFVTAEMECTVLEQSAPYYPSRAFLPPGMIDELLQVEGQPIIKPAYIYPKDERVKGFLDKISSFALSGQIMVRPTPFIMCLEKNLFQGRKSWKTISVEPNSPIETWFSLTSETTQNAIPFDKGDFVSSHQSELCSFTLPYLEGISFKDLYQVLEDEKDYLTEFRKGVREMLEELEKESSFPKDLYNDVARPAVDKIERKFKSISESRSMRIKGAVLAGAVISLAALNTTGVIAALVGALGGTAFNSIVKEWSEKTTGKADLREMPHYLLWRLKQEQKK
jgi:hypothetical protein